MISASEAKERLDQIKKEKAEEYQNKFPRLYQEAKDKLEAAINTAMDNVRNDTHIMLHNMDLAEKLEKECVELGYKVKYSLKERTFRVEW